jgi:UPF0755 protein
MKKVKYLILIVSVLIIIGIIVAYSILLGDGIRLHNGRSVILIPTGSKWEQVFDSVNASFEIKNRDILTWVAKKKRYPQHIKPGRYVIEKNISYIDLVNLLRSGDQTPVRVTFNNIRYLNELAGRIGGQIEADSAQIMDLLSNPDNYRNDGFTRENVISVFIPNTYEFYWNTNAREFYTRMLKEYRRFWNAERLEKAKKLNLTPVEVSILASIIDDEVTKSDEKPKIAGVYLNRLNRGIPLQACPTIKFALNDFTITRVLNQYLKIESPYNTYLHRGFPPGPIGCPTIEGIEAVLNAEKHDYFYFAAKADFSGYHNFSRTLTEHNRYAAEYQRELDKRRIFK